MLDGYHRIFSAHALRQVDRGIDVPQPALGVGFAERTASLNMPMVFSPIQKNPTYGKIVTLDHAAVDGQGDPLDASSFPRSGYMGDMLGGF